MKNQRLERSYERLSRWNRWVTPVLLPLIAIMVFAMLIIIGVTAQQERDEVIERNRRSAEVLDEALRAIADSAEERSLRHDEADTRRAQLILDSIHALRLEVQDLHVLQHKRLGLAPPKDIVPEAPPIAPGKARVGSADFPPIPAPPTAKSTQPPYIVAPPDDCDGFKLLFICLG